jgi:hypothetical protein
MKLLKLMMIVGVSSGGDGRRGFSVAGTGDRDQLSQGAVGEE